MQDDLALRIDHAQVHHPCVQVEPGVKCVLSLVQSHRGSPELEGNGRATRSGAYLRPTRRTLLSSVIRRFADASQTWETMMSINRMHATRPSRLE